MKLILLTSALLITSFIFAQQVTTVTGYAPQYVGKQVEILQIQDYLTMREERIASATVGTDSTFTCNFFLKETRKLIIRANNNKTTIYASPGARYSIYMPDRNPHEPYRPLGNNVEATFFGLDSTDINYKILSFNRWADDFLFTYYTRNNAREVYFSKRLDTFKLDVAQYYKNDTADLFFAAHVRYSLAKIDNMRFLGSRNQYEKYDFYLRNTSMVYQSDTYMDYVNQYYEKMLHRIDPAINEKIYQGLLKSSPTAIMGALGTEYTMFNNIQLREFVMVKTLGDAFFEKDFPQTNILTVLDSTARFSRFENNRLIASNLIMRLNELTPGAKAPDFSVTGPNGLLDLNKLQGKHVYLIFVNPDNVETDKQVALLEPLYRKYSNEIKFLMVIRKGSEKDVKAIETLQKSVPWESVVVDPNHRILSSYQIVNMPYYVLVDPYGYIVGAPALGPTPNGQYQTIDRTFFDIKRVVEESKEEKH